MRRLRSLTLFSALAALAAISASACKYSTTAAPLPGPSPAPTFGAGVVTEEQVPTPNATPFGITAGPDGNVWFTELNGDRVGRVALSTFPTAGSITECGTLAASAQPADITSAPGSAKVWFDEFSADKIASVNTSTCAYTEYQIPTGGAQPSGLVADQSGVLWFAESATGVAAIARMTTSGVFNEYPVALAGSDPVDVAIAGDNTVWYLDNGRNSVGHLTFPGGSPTFVDYAIPSNPAQPATMTLGPDGNLWFTELGIATTLGCQIAKVSVGSNPPTITEYRLPLAQPAPDGDLCLGITSAGGDLWFSEADTGAIGRITTTGVVTEWGIPGNGTTALFVATGPDANVWFTDGAFDSNVGGVGTNQIGQVKIANIHALPLLRTFKAKAVSHRLLPLNVHGMPKGRGT